MCRDIQGFPSAGRAAPQGFSRSGPVSPWTTPLIPPLLLRLTQCSILICDSSYLFDWLIIQEEEEQEEKYNGFLP